MDYKYLEWLIGRDMIYDILNKKAPLGAYGDSYCYVINWDVFLECLAN